MLYKNIKNNKIPRNVLIFDMPSDVYHSPLTDTYSSSQLKTMLEDPEIFHRKYITKEEARQESNAFAVGSYIHCSILEPDKVNDECAFWDGIRRGQKWDEFTANNQGKAIVTMSEKENADLVIKAIKNSPIAMQNLDGFKNEVSLFIDLYVFKGEIYSFKGEKILNLCNGGWRPTETTSRDSIEEFGTKLTCKVRADALGVGKGIISDIKSTSGNCKNKHEMQSKISAYSYDLSAAFYLDLFSLTEEEYEKFVWIFASKDKHNSKSYLATDRNIMVGRAKWRKAILEIAYYVKNKWVFSDTLGELEPQFFETAWLEEAF